MPSTASFMNPSPKKVVKKVVKKATKGGKSSAGKAVKKATSAPVRAVKKVKKNLSVFARIRQASNLNLSNLESNKGQLEVWALNIAASAHGKNSQVLVAVKNANGKSSTVIVPDTWIPICLTTQVGKDALLGSSEFRAALAGNQHHGPLLRIIATDEAYAILGYPEAQKEQARMNKIRSDQRSAQRIQAPKADDDEERVNLADGKQRKSKPTASGMIIGMTLNHKNGQLDDDQFLNTLKANLKSLKRIDLEYLTSNSTSSRVKKWAAKRLGA